ncbi:MAG: flagellar basal body P-ring protein FlgI, partial [Aliifodinibius sp.]|nr:flagellar basal body P-ring protein FlgI [candidate division Zixibacteria bacterium]NIT55147.1 flagellar basal body P-ring protein FlgI [Fodinibius sp.]NIU12721.1 flagellar basal body P-ring protein FlgI [candidate division Zixibacteria bacterium]NIV04826.1 flagellar basal body P-ring protein FlgI [candidate division Zixibacteria bacterium]NIY23731.1 flagellar basal body P-ring protein FlgI [Fodinibius sp.]
MKVVIDRKLLKICFFILGVSFLPQNAFGQVRIKDLTRLEGIEYHQLVGYGLVIGLNGSGDSRRSQFTTQSIVNMLQKFGVTVPRDKIRIRNVAAVMATAEAPSFARQGDRIDVTVSSIGDAKTLEGGVLLMTPLVLQEGNLIAMAQGPLSVGGFSVETTGGGGVRQNHTLVGRIPQGGLLKKDLGEEFQLPNTLRFSLREKDITTTQRIVEAVNRQFAEQVARPLNPYTIEVEIPRDYQQQGLSYAFLSELQQLKVTPDVSAKVVINERTGTIVIGGSVAVLPAAIAHGNLSVEIRSEPIVSQPAPFSQGQTAVVPNTEATVYQDEGQVVTIDKSVTVQD